MDDPLSIGLLASKAGMSNPMNIILTVTIVVLVFLSAFFSASETAFTSLNLLRIKTALPKKKAKLVKIRKTHFHDFGREQYSKHRRDNFIDDIVYTAVRRESRRDVIDRRVDAGNFDIRRNHTENARQRNPRKNRFFRRLPFDGYLLYTDAVQLHVQRVGKRS